MFGGDVPAATNNTSLKQLSTQAGRDAVGQGGPEVEKQIPKWTFTLLQNDCGKESRKEVMWEILRFG